MDFELSDDQVALQDAARELLDGYASPAQVRTGIDAGGGLDTKLWAAMIDQGWPGIAVPESMGGLGLGLVEVAVLLEQVGSHVAPAPVLQQVVALDALVRSHTAGGDDHATIAGWIEGLVAGTAAATVASTPVAARPTPRGWLLSGSTEDKK